MRALITGGAGFIGSHIAERLLERGRSFPLMDNLSTGGMDNIRHLKQYDRMQYFLEPIENRQLLAELVDEADMVFHLAAAVGVRLIVESPVRTIETNVNGTQLVLEAANKKRKLVFAASTSEVYGKSVQVPFTEEADLVLGPTSKGRWSYAASKALDEFLALSYWKERRVPVVIARLFNTVGPRQTGRYGMVMPSLVGQALMAAEAVDHLWRWEAEPVFSMYAIRSRPSCVWWGPIKPWARSSTSAAITKSPSRVWLSRSRSAQAARPPLTYIPYDQA